MNRVPKLRFKEFSEEWKEKKLKDLFSFKQGYQIPATEQIKTKIEGYERYLYISDFFSDKNILYVKEENKEKILEKDITIANTGNTAGSFYRGKKGILSNNMFSIKNDNSTITNDFLFCFLGTSLYFNQLETLFNSSGQPHLGHKNMGIINIKYPNLQEQQKIADFLSNIDKKISITEEKLDLFKEYKKGIMQKIFNQELRFKDSEGNNYPEWEEKRLEEIADCLDNKRKPLNSTERDKIKGNIPYYGANGIQGYINDFIFDEELVLLAEDGGNFDDYLNKPIAQYIYGKSWINNHAHILKGKKGTFTKFLFYSLEHKDIRNFINGTSRSKLNKSDMLNISIFYPCLEEQQKIADFLSSIDNKIDNLASELEDLKEFKKGLLQQMFV